MSFEREVTHEVIHETTTEEIYRASPVVLQNELTPKEWWQRAAIFSFSLNLIFTVDLISRFALRWYLGGGFWP